ncbi:MAG: cytochrome c biogenesis protein CcdA [Planctomycetota bacterium]
MTHEQPVALRCPARSYLRWLLVQLALLASFAMNHGASAQGSSATKVSVRSAAALLTASPGDRLPIAVELDIAPDWHVWTSEAQSRALPAGMTAFDGAIFTAIEVKASPATAAMVSVADIQWPAPHAVKGDLGEGPQTFGVYEGKVIAFVPVIISQSASGTVEFTLSIEFQACSSTCLGPTTVEQKLKVEVVAGGRITAGAGETPLFAGFDSTVFGRIKEAAAMGSGGVRGTSKPIKVPLFGWDFELEPESGMFFPVMLLLAFVGGIILNFTPCVLPVIPLKIIGLANAGAGSRVRIFMLGLAMSVGVVGFWLALGILLSSAKGFEQSNQLFQYPAFTIGVGIFIALMAIGMAGFFSVGLPQWVYAIEPKHESIGGSVIFGVMTAVLSTPCTAPLMGAAAGWAVTTKNPSTIIAVFFTIGLGMGVPYLVLSAFPQMARKLPRGGPASDVLKQVMGLLLLAAAMYFIGAGINGLREEPLKIHWWLIGATGAAAGLWMVVRTLQIAKMASTKVLFVTTGLFITAISVAIPPVLTFERLTWHKYTPAALVDAQKAGKVAVLDFTAEWCINCKTYEKTILESDEVSVVLNEPGVVLLKIDITGKNEAGAAKLAELNYVTIPLLVVYAPNGTEVFKSEAYTRQQVIDAVRKAQGK